MYDTQNQIRDLFFYNIFGGGFYRSVEEIEADEKEIGISFPYRDFVLASVKIEEWGKPSEFEGTPPDTWELFFILRNVFTEVFTFDGCVSQGARYQGRFVLIINSDFSGGWQDILREKAKYAVEFLAQNFDLDVVVAFSRMAGSMLALDKVYDDTKDVHDYVQVINEDMQAVFFDDLTHSNMQVLPQTDLNYIEMQTTLRSCIRRFDTDGARLATSELISRGFYDTPPTVQIFRFRVYGLVNSLLYILEELRTLMGFEEYDKLDVGPRLTRAETLSDILAEVEDIYDQLDDYSKNHESENQPKWVGKIRQYVEDNFQDVNVTVSSAANHFGMTPSYCTRAFKRYIGVSLFDYIQQKRIEAAKKLLAQNMSLNQVSEQVGFSSTLTMNRAFKRYEGVSPGKFKNL